MQRRRRLPLSCLLFHAAERQGSHQCSEHPFQQRPNSLLPQPGCRINHLSTTMAPRTAALLLCSLLLAATAIGGAQAARLPRALHSLAAVQAAESAAENAALAAASQQLVALLVSALQLEAGWERWEL